MVGQAGESPIKEFIPTSVVDIRSEAEDGWGTGDRGNVRAGCTGMEAHGRLGCY